MGDWASTLFQTLGGAASGAMEGYQLHEGMRLKEKEIDSDERAATLKAEIQQMIASMNVAGKKDVAEIGARAKTEAAEIAAKGKEVAAQLAATGRLDVARLTTDTNRYVAELLAENRIDVEEARGLQRINWQKEINSGNLAVAGTNAASREAVAGTQAQAQRDVAGIQGNTARDVANITQGTDVTVGSTPLRAYDAESRRITAQRPVAGRAGGSRFQVGGTAPGSVGSPITPPSFNASPAAPGLSTPRPPASPQGQQPTPLAPSMFGPSLFGPALQDPQGTQGLQPSLNDMDPDYPNEPPDQPDWTPTLDQGAAAARPAGPAPTQAEVQALGDYLKSLVAERRASTDPKKRAELQSMIQELVTQLKEQAGR